MMTWLANSAQEARAFDTAAEALAAIAQVIHQPLAEADGLALASIGRYKFSSGTSGMGPQQSSSPQ